MTESSGTSSPSGPLPGATPAGGPRTGPIGLPVTAAQPVTEPAPSPSGSPSAPPAAHPTAPVATQPRVRPRRTDPLTRMGPWAPVAGALLGLLLGGVAVLLLAATADAFPERLALVFLVVGLGMLGAAGALLADEVRLVRRGAREATIRPAWVEATSGLLNGLTPARLLLATAAFVLFLSAYVSRG